MSYDPTIYRGSAPHYLPGRPPYSPSLAALLEEALDLDGHGRMLDAGCGPGVLALRLAFLFDHVVGLDPDPDMLSEARRRSNEQRVTNVSWIRALAEDLPAAAPGPFRLVTFGQSFHRTDEHRVAETVYDMLEPGGALALIAHSVEGRPVPPNPGYPPIPHDELDALVKRYLGPRPRSGQGFVKDRNHSFEDVLVRTRFGTPRSLFAPGIPDLVRDTESILSGLLSMTPSAPHLFGDRLGDFASDVRQLLRARSPDGRFWDWPGDTLVVLARRDGRGV